MKFCATGCWGYFNDDFVVKEIAICREGEWLTCTFTCPKPFEMLTQDELKQVRYLEKNVHGLRYSSPGVMYSPALRSNASIHDILRYYFKDIDRVYLKGLIRFVDEKLKKTIRPLKCVYKHFALTQYIH